MSEAQKLLSDLRKALADTYSLSPEGRAYLNRMDAAIAGRGPDRQAAEKVDYDALIAAAAKAGYAQGTTKCVAFKEGAEWQAARSTPKQGEAVDFECEDCIGCHEHGCYCKAMGASQPGGPAPSTDLGDLHHSTTLLIDRFAIALKKKLADAEKKYGYSDGWASPDWMDECRQHLMEHIAKGDPRDVAAYCAFLWHHGERTSAAPSVEPPQANSVPMPKNEDQAALMALIGENWLRENAPHRLRAQAAHQEPGWVRVPVEPTSEMLAALSQEWHPSKQSGFRKRYADLIAAAPKEGQP